MDVTSDGGDRPWESYHTVFTNAKAGMDGVDKEKVQRIVYEMSKGSKYFENEQKKEAIIQQKIEHMRLRSAKLTSSDLSHFQMIADKKIIELEASRVLSRIWLHVDMDAFYAAVETLENPSLKGKPLAVGSLSMISTANYEARTFGVRAAMPGFIARKLCPDLTFVPVDFKKYTHYSEVTRKVFCKYDPHFIAASLDEAYLDITEVCRERGVSGAEIAEELRAAVNKETSLTCSAGVGPNRLLAKVCSDINKPNGQFVLPNERIAVMTFISSLPIRKIGGIGKVTEHVLRDVLGINTCEEMIKKSAYIVALFSSCSADFFLSVALGVGRTDTPQSKMRKSISSERTFSATEDEALIFKRLADIAENLSNDMEKEGLLGRTLTLKVKTASFEVRSRAVTLQNSISSKEDILCHASKLLKAELPLSLRLIGLRMSQFGGEKCGLADRTQKTITNFVFSGDASLKKMGSDNSSILEIYDNQSSDENEIGHWAADVSMGPSNYDHLLEYEGKFSSLGNDASEKRNYSEPMKHEEYLAKMVNDSSTITTHVIQPDGIEGSELLEREACSSSAQANTHTVGGPCKMPKISDDKWAISSNQDQCTWIDDYKCSLCGFELPPNFDEERQDHSDYHFAEMLQKEEYKHGSRNLLQKRFAQNAQHSRESVEKKLKSSPKVEKNLTIDLFFVKGKKQSL